jgi:hypothetical protein
MADFILLFLSETLDIDKDKINIEEYLDESKTKFQTNVLYNDETLHKNLMFRFMWNIVVGTWPSKHITKDYLTNVNDTNVTAFWNYMKQRMPLYNFVAIDLSNLEALKSKYDNEIRSNPDKIKAELVKKWSLRYGMRDLQTYKDENLFDIFKIFMQNGSGFELLKILCLNLSKIQGKPIIKPNITIQTTNDYFKLHESVIQYYELRNINVFTGSWNNNPQWYAQQYDATVFDTIANVVYSDNAFIRSLIESVTIYNNIEEQVNEFDRLSIILEAASDTFGNQANLVVFDGKEPYTNICFYNYNHIHAWYANFIPTLSKYFICIGDDVYPPARALCKNKANSVYYYIYDTIKPVKQNDRDNEGGYNRYITNDLANINELEKQIDGKKVYVIVDKNYSDIQCSQDILYNNYFALWQWKNHMQYSCPFNTLPYTPRYNHLLYEQFLVKYFTSNIERVDNIKLNPHSTNAVVIIDNRKNILLILSLFITLMNLESDQWRIIMICNEENRPFYEMCFNLLNQNESIKIVIDDRLKTKRFNLDVYNDILKSPSFWEKIDCSTGLFVQDDGMICRPGVERFCTFDYVGAPWEKTWPGPNKYIMENINNEMIGNGGVSIRRIDVMKNICIKYSKYKNNLHYDKIQQQPEDVYFSYYCKKEGLNMPKYEEGQKFSTEQVVNNDSCGFHKFWVYHDKEVVKTFFDNVINQGTTI